VTRGNHAGGGDAGRCETLIYVNNLDGTNLWNWARGKYRPISTIRDCENRSDASAGKKISNFSFYRLPSPNSA